MDDVELEFSAEALREIAHEAMVRETGARGLRAIIENVMTDIMYEIPSDDAIEKCIVTKDTVINGSEPDIIKREAKNGKSQNKKKTGTDEA